MQQVNVKEQLDNFDMSGIELDNEYGQVESVEVDNNARTGQTNGENDDTVHVIARKLEKLEKLKLGKCLNFENNFDGSQKIRKVRGAGFEGGKDEKCGKIVIKRKKMECGSERGILEKFSDLNKEDIFEENLGKVSEL